MWLIKLSGQHRYCYLPPVRMNVACYESVTSHRQRQYRFIIGSPLVSILFSRAVQDGPYSSRRGHWGVVRNASPSSELPDSAGGLAVRIGRFRRRHGIRLPGCDDSRDIGAGLCHGSGSIPAYLVRGPITSKHLRASRTGLRGAHPLNRSDALGSRDSSPDRVTNGGLGERCFARSAVLQGVDRNLLKEQGFRCSLRRTSPRSSTTDETFAIPALGRDWTTGTS